MALISVEEADKLLAGWARLLPAEDCPLAAAQGRVLRAPIVADRALPPCDRVTLDGYALRFADWAAGARAFRISGMQAAGQPARALETGAEPIAMEVATGAVLPLGADVILPYEDAVRDGVDGNYVNAREGATLAPRQGIHSHGSDRPAGAILVAPGVVLGARELAAASSVGAAVLSVSARPRVALLATGDELVEVGAPAAPHQVRRSNDHALRAAALAAGAGAVTVRLARDDPAAIEAALAAVLDAHDLVLVTGGVSKGRFDYLPAALAAVGVERIFHGVAQRPGKPLWAGVARSRTPAAATTGSHVTSAEAGFARPLVLALPGSPVSAYTCFSRYGRELLRRMLGSLPPPATWLELIAPVTPLPRLTWLAPVRCVPGPDGDARLRGTIVPTNTSGDLFGLVGTDGWVELEPAEAPVPAGTVVRWHRWETA